VKRVRRSDGERKKEAIYTLYLVFIYTQLYVLSDYSPDFHWRSMPFLPFRAAKISAIWRAVSGMRKQFNFAFYQPVV
jgi:hypothetical protein